MKLADIIDTFITGDWGEESPTQDTPNAAYCVRGADIVPITNHNFTDIPQRYVCDRTKETKLLAAGDLVIEKSGGSPTQSTGRIVYVSEDLIKAKGNVVCSNFCTAFRVKAGWNPLYVYYFWQNVYNHGAFFNFEGKTSGIKNLQLDNALSAIDIEYLPLEKQNQIVASLASIDEKIKVNRQINDNLEAMAKQLYDYWFVQFDFPNEEGKPYKSCGGAMVWNEKLKREIPKEWMASNYTDLFTIGNGQTMPQNEGLVPAYGGNGIVKMVEISNYPACIIIGRVGANCGSIHYSKVPCWVSDNAISICSKNDDWQPFLFYSLKLYNLSKNKGGSSQPLITHEALKHLYFPMSEKHINQFCHIVNELQDLIYSNQQEILKLTKQRDELLPLLMNGQATVNYHLSASTSISFDISVLFLNFTNGNSLYETISLDYQCFALPLHSKENTHGTIQEDKRHIQQRQRQGD